jgi:hypothetical protein
MAFRRPTSDEARLLRFLLVNSRVAKAEHADELLVEEVSDGGMGSLRLLPKSAQDVPRRFGSTDLKHLDGSQGQTTIDPSSA